jgi:glycosyltransferase involved in cell wall biosynthesis
MTSALEVWALSGGGGAPSLYRTLEAYGRRGHEVDLVAPTIGANHHAGAPETAPPAIEGVRYHLFHLPSLQESRNLLPGVAAKADQKLRFALLFPYLAARRVSTLLRERTPDVLYGYEVHGVLAQRLIRRRLRRPLVARFQGTVMHPYLGRPLSLLRKGEETLALRTAADLYVMTDDGTRGNQVLARLNPGSAGKVRFWRNGLDLAFLRPPAEEERRQARLDLGLAEDAFVLVTASRLARWKRVDRAIDAVARLDASLRTLLLVVGDGEERSALERRAASLGLGENVRFAGAVPAGRVRAYLWAADVFLSVNELSNVGNPLLEAMATGRCILTLDEGDTGDLIADGETGLLLADPSPAAIAAGLGRLAADPSLRRRMADGAHAFACRNFWTWEQRLDAEIDAVEALAGGARDA